MRGYRAVFDALPERSPRIPLKTVWRIDEREAIGDGAFLCDMAGGQIIYKIEITEVELYDFNWTIATSRDKWQCDEAYFPLRSQNEMTREVQLAVIYLHYAETENVLRQEVIRIKDLERR